jgi:hypothetical protein
MSAARVLKDLLKAAHASAPGQRLRGLVAPPAGVTVLTYHRVLDGSEPFDGLPLDAFRAQMRWLARHCDALSADEFVHTRPSGRSRGRRRVLITTTRSPTRCCRNCGCRTWCSWRRRSWTTAA